MIRPHPTKLPPTTLHLEDLQQLNEILLTYTQDISYEVAGKCQDYRYSSLEELVAEHSKIDTSISDLTIYANWITVSILSSSTRISYYGDEPAAFGIVAQLSNLCVRHTSWVQKWQDSVLYMFLPMLTICAFLVHHLQPNMTVLWYVINTFCFSFTGTSFLLTLMRIIPFKVVYLTPRKKFNLIEKTLENPATIIGAILSAIIGSVITVFFTCNK